MGDKTVWETPDWTREKNSKFWEPSRKLIKAIRDYQAAKEGWRGNLTRFRAKYRHWFWSVVTQAELHLECKVGGGLLLPHPNGIVVHPDAVIGPNCLLFQQVTLGTVASRDGVPVLGAHVDVGAGAKLLGGITVGDHAVIGANSVVIKDVPSCAIVAGIPARIVGRRL